MRSCQARRVLANAVADAERRGLIDRNPSRLVRSPPAGKREPEPLTLEQIRRSLDAARTHPMGALFTVLALSDLRIGETLGIQWTDIDWHSGRVQIARHHPENSGLIFGARGGLLRTAIVNRVLAALCAGAGLPHLTPHLLRHNYASTLVSNGVPIASSRCSSGLAAGRSPWTVIAALGATGSGWPRTR